MHVLTPGRIRWIMRKDKPVLQIYNTGLCRWLDVPFGKEA